MGFAAHAADGGCLPTCMSVPRAWLQLPVLQLRLYGGLCCAPHPHRCVCGAASSMYGAMDMTRSATNDPLVWFSE